MASFHRKEGHLQGFELCFEIAHECRAENPSAESSSSNGECHGQLGRRKSQPQLRVSVQLYTDSTPLHSCTLAFIVFRLVRLT